MRDEKYRRATRRRVVVGESFVGIARRFVVRVDARRRDAKRRDTNRRVAVADVFRRRRVRDGDANGIARRRRARRRRRRAAHLNHQSFRVAVRVTVPVRRLHRETRDGDRHGGRAFVLVLVLVLVDGFVLVDAFSFFAVVERRRRSRRLLQRAVSNLPERRLRGFRLFAPAQIVHERRRGTRPTIIVVVVVVVVARRALVVPSDGRSAERLRQRRQPRDDGRIHARARRRRSRANGARLRRRVGRERGGGGPLASHRRVDVELVDHDGSLVVGRSVRRLDDDASERRGHLARDFFSPPSKRLSRWWSRLVRVVPVVVRAVVFDDVANLDDFGANRRRGSRRVAVPVRAIGLVGLRLVVGGVQSRGDVDRADANAARDLLERARDEGGGLGVGFEWAFGCDVSVSSSGGTRFAVGRGGARAVGVGDEDDVDVANLHDARFDAESVPRHGGAYPSDATGGWERGGGRAEVLTKILAVEDGVAKLESARAQRDVQLLDVELVLERPAERALDDELKHPAKRPGVRLGEHSLRTARRGDAASSRAPRLGDERGDGTR